MPRVGDYGSQPAPRPALTRLRASLLAVVCIGAAVGISTAALSQTSTQWASAGASGAQSGEDTVTEETAVTQTDSQARGAALYQRFCAVCHAHDGTGVPGVGPPIVGLSLAKVDLAMRTGRMPLEDPRRGVRERTFSPAERSAVTAYLADALELEGALPEPEVGDGAAGREVYASHCGQCHGGAGEGGLAGDGVEIPPVVGLDPVTIAASVREGPFTMPQFSEELISDEELADLIAFLDEDLHEPTSPLGLAHLSMFQTLGFVAVLAVVVLLVCAWAGGARRSPVPGGGGEGPLEQAGTRDG